MQTVKSIADQLGVRFEGNGDLEISGVAALVDARSGEISFLANARYRTHLQKTHASAVIVAEDFAAVCPCALIRVENPDQAFAKVTALLSPPPYTPAPGIHPTALIAEDVELGKDAHVGAYCVIESGTRIGDNAIIMAHAYIGPHVVLGDHCRIFHHVSIRENVEIGDRVWINNGSVIGSEGFGYVENDGVRTKVPQVGTVSIGDDAEIGANVTIDRARFGKTRIGKGVKIDNLVMIAHNVIIEDHAVIVAQVGISGSSIVRKKAILAGQVGVAGHLEIGEGAIVGAQGGVTKNVPAGTMVSGYPAIDHRKAANIHAHTMRLPKLKQKLDNLEQRVDKLEG